MVKTTKLLPENLMKFVSDIIDQIFHCMHMFREANQNMRYLKIPRKFASCLCNLTSDPNVSKFIIGFADAAPTTNLDIPFSNASYSGKIQEYNVGFLSGIIYLVHFCKENRSYISSLITCHNRIASNLPIVKLE